MDETLLRLRWRKTPPGKVFHWRHWRANHSESGGKTPQKKITGKKIKPQYDPPRTGDIRDSQADISLARKILGYQPVVEFEEGLRRTWAWYSKSYTKS